MTADERRAEGRYCSGLSAARMTSSELSVSVAYFTYLPLTTLLDLSEAVVDDVELPMVSMLSTQGRDSRLTICSPPGNEAIMKPAQELGESSWDNG